MPQIPIIIPLLILGVLFGSMIKAGKKSIPKRRLLVASLVSGVLNAANAYLLTLLSPRTTLPAGFAANRSLQQPAELTFFTASFLTGLLLVLAVFAVTAIYIRVRGRGEVETIQDSELEEESELTTG